MHKILVLLLTFTIFSSVSYAASHVAAKRNPSGVDPCFETAQRLAMFAFETTEGGYGATPFLVEKDFKPISASNQIGTYPFTFGFNPNSADAGQPTYTLSFDRAKSSGACILDGLVVKH